MDSMNQKLLFKTKACSGCKICVIQCSFHHQKTFSLAQSSLEVIIDLPHNNMKIIWYTDKIDTHPACDFCHLEPDGPICVKECPEKVITHKEDLFERKPSTICW